MSFVHAPKRFVSAHAAATLFHLPLHRFRIDFVNSVGRKLCVNAPTGTEKAAWIAVVDAAVAAAHSGKNDDAPRLSDADLAAALEDYNTKTQQSIVISWKREQLGKDPGYADEYERFLYEVFPENIHTVPKKTAVGSDDRGGPAVEDRFELDGRLDFSEVQVTWIDKRVVHDGWKDLFNTTRATDPLPELGLPPGIE